MSSLVLCFAIAYAGSAVTLPSINTWYPTLAKPFFNPPNYVFGPVWTILYFLMAVSLALIWSAPKKKHTKQAIQYFMTQLALNFLWSLVFFGFHLPLFALFVILFLWAAIFKSILQFLSISQTAAFLMIPYLIWVSFATILNLAIVFLNF